jgi:hypothetical protein
MVANFYHLKATGVFSNVPVRANHPGWMTGGDIDQVGAYVSELKREGKYLVADIRVVDEKMKEHIENGKYINRSAEIGTYDDNNGNLYTPTLFGFAWVDIPQVEGLSPVFSYRNNTTTELINLNKEDMIEEKEVKEEVAEEVNAEAVADVVTEVAAEVAEVAEEVVAETVTELSKDFSKNFPAEFAELTKLREAGMNDFVASMKAEGKILPLQAEKVLAFAKGLSKEQFSAFEAIMKDAPKLIELDKEVELSVEKPAEKEVEKTPSEKAAEFIKETN